MNSLLILDVVIGLVFVYLLYSMLATIVQEFLATLFSFRAKVLDEIVLLLEDKMQAQFPAEYSTSLVENTYDNKPSHLDI